MIILTDPKYPHNVGQVVRAASCFAHTSVLITGDRVPLQPHKGYRLPREERMREVYDVHVAKVVRPIDYAVAEGRIPVAIELVSGAQSMPWFEHPEHAAYVFGPEDGHLDSSIRRHCHHVVSLPMIHCANLASCVWMTLYDAHCKAVRDGREAPLHLKKDDAFV